MEKINSNTWSHGGFDINLDIANREVIISEPMNSAVHNGHDFRFFGFEDDEDPTQEEVLDAVEEWINDKAE